MTCVLTGSNMRALIGGATRSTGVALRRGGRPGDGDAAGEGVADGEVAEVVRAGQDREPVAGQVDAQRGARRSACGRRLSGRRPGRR